MSSAPIAAVENRVTRQHEKPDRVEEITSRLAALFVISVLLNFPWEVALMPLYVEDGSWFEFALHCIVPSLGDGLTVMLIFCAGWVAQGRSDWADQPGWAAYVLILTTGFSVTVIVEWMGFYGLNRWSYTASMPLLPGLGIGVVPVLEMLILPLIIFKLTGSWLMAHGSWPMVHGSRGGGAIILAPHQRSKASSAAQAESE